MLCFKYYNKCTLLLLKHFLFILDESVDLNPFSVNKAIFKSIKEFTSESLPADRFVVLTFEDYPIKEVNPKWNTTKKKKNIPDYCIILTIRRITTPVVHQPIACITWDRKNLNLAKCIKIYICALHIAGLTVVSTVCSHAPHFVPIVCKLLDVRITISFQH